MKGLTHSDSSGLTGNGGAVEKVTYLRKQALNLWRHCTSYFSIYFCILHTNCLYCYI